MLVFKNRDNHLLLRFFGVYAFSYSINVGLLSLLNLAGVGSLVAGAIIVLPVAAVSFLLMQIFVFKTIPKA